MQQMFSMIRKEADIFASLFLGDGTTVSRTTLLKILVCGKNFSLDIFDFFVQIA